MLNLKKIILCLAVVATSFVVNAQIYSEIGGSTGSGSGTGDVSFSDTTLIIGTKSDLNAKVNLADSTGTDEGSYTTGYQASLKLNSSDFVTFIADSDYIDLYVPLLLDTVPFYTFGAYGDTTLFEKNDSLYGAVNVGNDTTVVPIVRVLDISSGDSCTFNLYYGTLRTGTIVDSLFDNPEPVGVNQSILVPDNVTKIPPNQDLWMKLSGDQITNYAPTRFVLQVFRQLITDND